jgi:predicted TPR repeat methyltransferase
MAHCTLGEPEKAVDIFQKWLEEEPENPIARHMLAACSNQAVPARAADAYVEKVFDDFAASFDTKLAGLSYQAPQIVAAMLADAGLEAAKALVVLDAGCGTGLCGPLIAPYAKYLAGVDLSAQMLARAHERGVYDELAKAELTGYLASHPETYDVVVSADTLVYFGDLREVVQTAAAALRAGGHLVFTIEELVDGPAGEPFRIGTHGRYAHTAGYVTGVLADAGFEPCLVRAELRMEAGAPVAGLAVRGTKRGGERHG